MGEHKRNPTAIYFKENPWAPDFRPLLGKRKPRGKGIRRIYKIMMERSTKSDSLGDGHEQQESSGEKKTEDRAGIRSCKDLKDGQKDKPLNI